MAQKPLTILIHGLHQNRHAMYLFAKQLQSLGYPTYCHNYASLQDSIDDHSSSLNHWLCANHDPKKPIHLIGHSLGGLVIRHFLANYPTWQIGRCVTLGTPHQGSVCANYIKHHFAPLISRAYLGALDGTCPPLPSGISLGIIAGNKPWGVGMAFLGYHNQKYKRSLTATLGEHDGTVYISETHLAGATDHLILPTTHTGLLIDKLATYQTVYFLEHGQFDKN